jgi:hypothetical protein
VGWQSSPSRRGTVAILESCIFTILACTWSILHLNLPGPFDSASKRLWRKVCSAILTAFLPEIVLAHAIVERAAATQSLQELKALGIHDLEICYNPWSWRRAWEGAQYLLRMAMCCCPKGPKSGGRAAAGEDAVEIGPPRRKWSLKHSYYVNMGGLRLGRTGGGPICRFTAKDFPSIALTVRQFTYLREKGVIEATPDIKEEEIDDKSKTDYFAKGIAVIQIFGLIVSLITRAFRHLTISQLEILSAAFAACAVVTYYFAWDKPQSVNTATTIEVAAALKGQDIRRIAQFQRKDLTVLLGGTIDIAEGSQLGRIHNGSIELSTGYMQPIAFWLTTSVMLFGAIHLSAWNFIFPSSAERILWRTSSVAITILPVLLILNIFISSASHGLEEEAHEFENSILSLWEDYITSRSPNGIPDPDLPPPLPFGDKILLLNDLAFHIPRWLQRDREISAIRHFIAENSTTIEEQARRENFEWFLTEFQLLENETDNEEFRGGRVLLGKKWELVRMLKARNGTAFSLLERTAIYLGSCRFGEYVLLAAGSLYIIFRLLIIMLSFTSLRAMPDTVYDTTWAKNIPSVQ